ncbi:MAG: PilW family protein [Steroidobacteraceae bacterium]
MNSLIAVRRRCPPRGFSLVELMISLAIGSVIVIALVSLFVNASRSNRDIARNNSMIENGRFAMHAIREDAWHAGYWINHVPRFDDVAFKDTPDDAPVLTDLAPNPCLAYSSWTTNYRKALIAVPVQAYESATFCSSIVQNKAPGTDVLVVRRAATCEPYTLGVGDCEPFGASSAELRFQNSLCEDELDPPEVGGVKPPATLFKLSNVTGDLTLKKRDCTTLAGIRRFVSNIYYVRTYATTLGDGIPTLVRSRFGLNGGVLGQLPAEPLVEGVEGFRVEFGIDNLSKSGEAVNPAAAVVFTDPYNLSTPRNRGDGSPDGAFIRCRDLTPCTNGQLMNAVVMRVHVIARGQDPVIGYTDDRIYDMGSAPSMCRIGSSAAGCDFKTLTADYRRQMFTSALRLANVAARRELPP